MRSVIIVLALWTMGSAAFGQECIRPDWGKCAPFPNGGSVTGVSLQKEHVQAEVPPGPEICVSNHEEIGGDTFAHFQRNGMAWPNEDFVVMIDDFCFFRK
jgi:hypothetical protein